MAGRIYPDAAIPYKRYNILFLMGLLQPARLSKVAYASRGTSRLVGAMTILYCSFIDSLVFVQTLVTFKILFSYFYFSNKSFFEVQNLSVCKR